VELVEGFVPPDELTRLLAALSLEALHHAGVELRVDATGTTAEVPVDHAPELSALAARITSYIGLNNHLPQTFRLRVAQTGDFHPAHLDDYTIDGLRLVATCLVYLTGCEGGATRFPRLGAGVQVEPQPGRALFWLNLRRDGSVNPSVEHAVGPVRRGPRVALAWFVYAPLDEFVAAASAPFVPGGQALVHRAAAGPVLVAPRVESRRFVMVVDEFTPAVTRAQLRSAAESRGLEVSEILGGALSALEPPLPPGSLLYRPATAWSAQQAERQLWQPGVVTFHRSDDGPFTVRVEQWLAFARAGLPTPRSIRLTTHDEDTLRAILAAVGGFPVIVRLDDGEGGVGVMRADSWVPFRSLCDLLASRRMGARVAAYIDGAVHWRCIVLGNRVLTAYLNPVRPDDFRSSPSPDPQDYALTPSSEMEQLAVAAATVAGSHFAGVDILVHPSGRLYVLEANFPCFFPQAESFGFVSVAQAMIDWLLLRAQEYDSLEGIS
jgi:hypothetical protein